MYSQEIIDRRLRAASKRTGVKYKRLPREKSIERAAAIAHLDPRQEKVERGLTKDEVDFIEHESAVCKADFSYWFTRYCNVELDPGVTPDGRGGVAPPVLAESQNYYIKLIGRREEECYQEVKKYQFTLGIHAYFHKTRQVMATATARALTWHRMLFWNGTRAFCATLDDPRIGELYKRDQIIRENLPWWQKPNQWFPDVKDTEVGIESPVNSRISYQAENQVTGIGTGSQNDVSHLTEVALWKYPGRIRFSFVPSIPKAITTLHVQESTADGKGNYWHEVTEAARHKKRGFEHWIYAFIPVWFNAKKYRSIPPNEWQPARHTISYAELVERTSPEFNDGVVFRPSVEHLYWWESTRAEHVRTGELSSFLTNYPATPEQSFQNPNQGALPAELMEEMEMEVKDGVPYEVETFA